MEKLTLFLFKSYFGSDDYSNDFDMRKPLERQFLAGRPIDCVSLLDSSHLSVAQDHCATFLSKFPRFFYQPLSLFDGQLGLSSFKSIKIYGFVKESILV